MILLRSLIFFLLPVVFSSCTIFSRSPSDHMYQLVQAGRFDSAIEFAAKKLRKNNNPEILYYRGCAAFSRGEFESAVDDFLSAEPAYTDDHFFYFNKGQAQMMGYDYEEARHSFLRAEKLTRSGEYSEQLKPLALVLPPHDTVFTAKYYAQIDTPQRFLAYIYYLVGLSYEREGGKDKFAMKYYTLAIDTDKDFLPALYRRARLYYDHGAYMVALDDVSRVCEKIQSNALLMLRAAIYERLGRTEDAAGDRHMIEALERGK
jgi:tetratricopeptide (TPR) repeat protein